MAWTYVANSASSNHGSASPITATLGATVSAGQRIIVGIVVGNFSSLTPSVTSVSDGVNTYENDATVIFTDGSVRLLLALYSASVLSSGTPTVTVAASQVGSLALAVSAYDGLNTSATPVDVTASQSLGGGGNTSPTSGATSPTAGPNELVVGLYGNEEAGSFYTFSAGGTATLRTSEAPDGIVGMALQDQDSDVLGSTPISSGTVTFTAPWGMLAVVYKLAAVAASAAQIFPALNEAASGQVIGKVYA